MTTRSGCRQAMHSRRDPLINRDELQIDDVAVKVATDASCPDLVSTNPEPVILVPGDVSLPGAGGGLNGRLEPNLSLRPDSLRSKATLFMGGGIIQQVGQNSEGGHSLLLPSFSYFMSENLRDEKRGTDRLAGEESPRGVERAFPRRPRVGAFCRLTYSTYRPFRAPFPTSSRHDYRSSAFLRFEPFFFF